MNEYQVSDDDIQRALPSYLAAMGSSGTVDHPQRVIKAVLDAVLPAYRLALLDRVESEWRSSDGDMDYVLWLLRKELL